MRPRQSHSYGGPPVGRVPATTGMPRPTLRSNSAVIYTQFSLSRSPLLSHPQRSSEGASCARDCLVPARCHRDGGNSSGQFNTADDHVTPMGIMHAWTSFVRLEAVGDGRMTVAA